MNLSVYTNSLSYLRTYRKRFRSIGRIVFILELVKLSVLETVHFSVHLATKFFVILQRCIFFYTFWFSSPALLFYSMKSFPRLWRGLGRSPNRRRQRAAGEKFFEDRLGYPTKILISFRNDKHFMALILLAALTLQDCSVVSITSTVPPYQPFQLNVI